MHPTALDLDNQLKLKQALQAEAQSSRLEDVVAALVGWLLGVPIAVARSSFQDGADAGPAGQQDRRFRLECKKYLDTSGLDRRELLGEIDQALMRDEALEAWILIVTRPVPEQLAQDLMLHGERIGAPVVILDWREHELGALTALCASGPDLVEALFSAEAGVHARALQAASTGAVEALRRNLASWCLGFAPLRALSHTKLQAIWNSPRTSNAQLAQDVGRCPEEQDQAHPHSRSAQRVVGGSCADI